LGRLGRGSSDTGRMVGFSIGEVNCV